MTLARRAHGIIQDGRLAILIYRAGSWLYWWEPGIVLKSGGSE